MQRPVYVETGYDECVIYDIMPACVTCTPNGPYPFADTNNNPLTNSRVLCFFDFQRDDEDEEVTVTDLGVVASSANGPEVQKKRFIEATLRIL